MEALRELENRLGIKPLSFGEGDIKLSPTLSPMSFELPKKQVYTKEEVIEKTVETSVKEDYAVEYGNDSENFLDERNMNFTGISNKWRVIKSNVINLYNHVKAIYERDKTSKTGKLCHQILQGMYLNNISKDKVNSLINELNGV